MKPLKIGICEDDATQIAYIKRQTEKFFSERDTAIVIETFESAEALLFEYPKDLPFFCLLLDIGLKKMDGMELAYQIRHRDKELPIVFITGERDYVFEGYKVGAVRFLLKPYNPEDFAEALSCVTERQREEPEEFIVLRFQGEFQKIQKREILYIEVRGHYLFIRTSSGGYEQKGSMKKIREELDENCFVPANRSVLINLYHVEKITRTVCVLSNGESVAVSRGCYQNLNRRFAAFYIKDEI